MVMVVMGVMVEVVSREGVKGPLSDGSDGGGRERLL